jgi:YggT family protein
VIAYYLIQGTKLLVLVFFAGATVTAVTHWAVKNGHLTPFSPLARAVRSASAPVIKPLEQRMLRSGGNPSSAPYVLFLVALLGGLALIGVVQWVIGIVYQMLASASYGPAGILRFVVNAAFSLVMLAILIRVIASWFGIGRYSKPMRIVYVLTDWIIEPLRKVVPPVGMFDITPLVAYFLLAVVQWLIFR